MELLAVPHLATTIWQKRPNWLQAKQESIFLPALRLSRSSSRWLPGCSPSCLVSQMCSRLLGLTAFLVTKTLFVFNTCNIRQTSTISKPVSKQFLSGNVLQSKCSKVPDANCSRSGSTASVHILGTSCNHRTGFVWWAQTTSLGSRSAIKLPKMLAD